jgi:hypothetical protein
MIRYNPLQFTHFRFSFIIELPVESTFQKTSHRQLSEARGFRIRSSYQRRQEDAAREHAPPTADATRLHAASDGGGDVVVGVPPAASINAGCKAVRQQEEHDKKIIHSTRLETKTREHE